MNKVLLKNVKLIIEILIPVNYVWINFILLVDNVKIMMNLNIVMFLKIIKNILVKHVMKEHFFLIDKILVYLLYQFNIVMYIKQLLNVKNVLMVMN